MIRPALALTCVAVGFAPAQQFVAQIDPSPAVPAPSHARLPVAGARGWFVARDGAISSATHGLYQTDGTIAGTTRVLDGSVEPLYEFAGRLLFTSQNGLYSTDGTAGGTVQLLASIVGTVKVFGSVNGRLVLGVGSGIWSTDMTPGGTLHLGGGGADFATTLGNEMLLFALGVGFYATDGISYFVSRFTFAPYFDFHNTAKAAPVLGNEAFFLVRAFFSTGVVDNLWRTDGTAITPVTALGPNFGRSIGRAGSGLVITGDTGTLFSDGTAAGTTVMTTAVRGFEFKTLGALAFFTGNTAANGNELWRTDGTSAGTFMLLDATPGPASSGMHTLTTGSTTLYCLVSNPGSQFLIASDGSVAGTRVLSTPQVVVTPGELAVLGDTALVIAQTPGLEPFATDGTTANSVQLHSNQVRQGMSGPFFAAPLLDELCFVSDDSIHGRELWRSDGTPGGTALVEDIAPGPADAVGEMVAMGGALWFGVGGKLYRSDGTAAGRTLVFDTGSSRIEGLQAGTNVLSFRAPAPFPLAMQIWRSDGVTTVASPLQIAGLAVPWWMSLQVGDDTYYCSSLLGGPLRLFRWNGQPSGGIDLGPAFKILGRLGSRVVFTSGTALRITDGTPGGTVTIGTLPTDGNTAQGNRRDGGTFLVVVDGWGGVHATNGTAVTTLPLTSPTLMTGGDDLVYLQDNHASLGSVLYSTDGTVAGTQLAVDYGSMPTSSAERMWPLGSGNRILLALRDDTHGVEPWISDGTAAGTLLLADLNPNGGSSNPVLLGVAGSIAWFVADDGVTGPELWRFDLPQVGAANVQSLGKGCPGSPGLPRVTSGDTPRLGATFTMYLANAMPNSIALWLVGSQIGETAIGGGCSLYFQSLDALFSNLTDGSGAAAAAVAIPNAASLVGLGLITQVGVFDPLGASPFGTSATAGLYWLIGN